MVTVVIPVEVEVFWTADENSARLMAINAVLAAIKSCNDSQLSLAHRKYYLDAIVGKAEVKK